MPAPTSGPFIKTTYAKDGTMTKEPVGFGGTLCQTATQPYEYRQGFGKKTATAEANDPPYLENESETQQKQRLG